MTKIYEEQYVKELFNKMSASYALMNRVTSFGFSERWRRQFIEGLEMVDHAVVVDFMTGMGECWPYIFKAANDIELIAVDFSPEMLKYASRQRADFAENKVTLLPENALASSIADNTADFLVSGFGLKTFNAEQLEILAREIRRILKPGGQFSLVDVSLPSNRWLKVPYLFYLKKVIPILGKLFLGDPETYKMLGIYTERYGNSENVKRIFEDEGLKVIYMTYFFGCATGVKGVNQY